MKPLESLIDTQDPGWPVFMEWTKEAKNRFRILPKTSERASRELLNAQVTTRSIMGAVIYETGGILIHDGWIRVLGSGSAELDRGVMSWNRGKSFAEYGDPAPFLLVADDLFGGYFAINAGAFGPETGKIFYLAPDTLQWENLEVGYSEFLYWLLTGPIEDFYQAFDWSTRDEDTAHVDANHTLSFVPFPWTQEGHDIALCDKRIVPVGEHYALTVEMMGQLSEQQKINK